MYGLSDATFDWNPLKNLEGNWWLWWRFLSVSLAIDNSEHVEVWLMNDWLGCAINEGICTIKSSRNQGNSYWQKVNPCVIILSDTAMMIRQWCLPVKSSMYISSKSGWSCCSRMYCSATLVGFFLARWWRRFKDIIVKLTLTYQKVTNITFLTNELFCQ